MVKRYLSLVLMGLCLLGGARVVRADSPDEQYVVIYNLIQEADGLKDKSKFSQAMVKYLEAQSALKRFHAGYPDWNVKVVNYRLSYLAARIDQISASMPPAADTNAPARTNTAAGATSTNNAPAPSAPSTPEPAAPEKAPATPPPNAGISPEAEEQIKGLQAQVRRMEAEKTLLEAKLKEALAAQPAALDPKEFAKAEEKIKDLQKENDLLKASLAQARSNAVPTDAAAQEKSRAALEEANRKLDELTRANTALAAEKEALQAKVNKVGSAPDESAAALRAENEILKQQVADLKAKGSAGKASDLNRRLLEAQSKIAALQSDKEILQLEKVALENRVKQMVSAGPTAVVAAAPAPAAATPDAAAQTRIKQLEAQRDELLKSLNAATKDLQGRKKGRETAERIEQLTDELANLRARFEAVEARKVPYTAEELALFQTPPNALVAAAHAPPRKNAKTISPETARLVDEARRYQAAGQLDKVEQKCLEILKTDEKNVVFLTKLAAVQVELNHLDDAEKYSRQAIALDPQDAYSHAVLGKLKFKQGKFDEALDSLSRAAQLNPNDPEIQNFLGLTFSEKGLRGPAETALRKAVQLDPGYANAHHNLAVIYITQKPPLTELARWHYQKALAAGQPRNPALEKLLDQPANEAKAAPDATAQPVKAAQ